MFVHKLIKFATESLNYIRLNLRLVVRAPRVQFNPLLPLHVGSVQDISCMTDTVYFVPSYLLLNYL